MLIYAKSVQPLHTVAHDLLALNECYLVWNILLNTGDRIAQWQSVCQDKSAVEASSLRTDLRDPNDGLY